MTRFGDRRVDPWAWLRDKSDPAVTAYLNAENRYTEAVMKPLAGFRDGLYREILGRILRTRVSANSGDLLGAATTIAQSAGLKGTPVVTRVGRDILVGVIPGNFNIQF